MSRSLLSLVTLLALAAGTPAAAEVYTWKKGALSDWSLPQNWTPAGVPGAQDTAIINDGIVTLSAPAQVDHLELNGGTLTRNAELTVSGGLRWTKGTLNGPGALHLLASAHSEILGSGYSQLSTGALNNAGTLSWVSGNFTLGGGAALNNTGVFEALSDGVMSNGYGFTVNNHGTFRKVGGELVTEISGGGAFNNNGLVEVRSGTFAFRAGTSSGSFKGAAGTVFRIGGTPVLTEASSIATEGDLDFASAQNLYVKGAVDVAGEIWIDAGQAHLSGEVSRMGSIRVTGGTLDLSTTNALTVPSVYLESGTLGGTAPITITDSMHWVGGSLSGAATLTAAPGSTVQLTGTHWMELNQRVLELKGTTIWTSTSYLATSSGARIHNEGSFEARSKGLIKHGLGASTNFDNSGTFTLAASNTFTVQGGIRFNNNGLVKLEQGTLALGQGTSTGRFESMPSAVLAINQWWWHDLAAGAVLELQGPLSIGASTTLRIAGALTLPKTVIIDGGTLAPNGEVKLTGQLEWLSGNIEGTGTLVIEPWAVVTHKGSSSRQWKVKVENRGGIHFEGASPINIGRELVLNNTGLIELRADTRLNGSGAVVNNLPSGVVRKVGGTGSSSFSEVLFNNRGTVEVLTGDLAFNAGWPVFSGTYTQTEGATLLKGGSLSAFSYNSGDAPRRRTLQLQGGVLGGDGTVHAHVNNGGIVRPGVDAQTPGILELDGTYTQTATGTVRIGIGGNAPGTGYGRLEVTEAKLNGALELVQLNGYEPPNGEALTPVRWLSGIRTGGFSSISGQDFGPNAYLNFKYTATDLTLYNGRASLSNVDVEVTGPRGGRPGQPAIYTVRIRNRNDVAMMVPVVLRLTPNDMLDMSPFEPKDDTYQDWVDSTLPGMPIPPPPGPGEEYPPLKRYFVDEDGDYSVPLMVIVPPGGTYEQVIKSGCGAGVSVEMGKPVDPHQLSNCLFALGGLLLEFAPGYDCIKIVTNGFVPIANQITTAKAASAASVHASVIFSYIQCIGDLLPASKAIKFLIRLNDALGKISAGDSFLEECKPYFMPDDKGGHGEATCMMSRDPNDKVGPTGVTGEHYITGKDTLQYAVFFENDPAATAPAQTVVVTDTLDATALDFSTFSFGTFTFGATTVTAPEGSKSFTQDVDMRPTMNLIVRIEAALDAITGVITWRFTSLDPETLEPTQDPFAGFLPPNKVKPEGQGVLTYTLEAKPNLVDGTTFGSGARIVFDTNEPIDTQPWTNRIDTKSPESQVLPLDLDNDGNIVVTWSGSDDGAGVKDYSVFVSVDGGEYTKWLSNTTDTTALFAGDFEHHHYAFYSVARDLLDHVEAAPLAPDATSAGLIVRPVLDGITAPSMVSVGAEAALQATFTGRAGTYAATWTWGDGTTSAGVVTFANGQGVVTGQHTYVWAGLYTVKLTLAIGPFQEEVTWSPLVVYDTQAGFVTGGGWIHSPDGAFADGPSRVGKAHLTLQVRYPRGSALPTGMTEFTLPSVGFSFRSSSHDWMVVRGAEVVIAGGGAIGGVEGYAFVLSLTDSEVLGRRGEDRFRMRIWNKASGELVYDNASAPPGPEQTTLGGGSLVIHAN